MVVSSGKILAAMPKSVLTPFRSVAPSPSNHVDTWRVGKIGLDVTRVGPAGGTVHPPVPMLRAATNPAAPSISQARSCAPARAESAPITKTAVHAQRRTCEFGNMLYRFTLNALPLRG